MWLWHLTPTSKCLKYQHRHEFQVSYLSVDTGEDNSPEGGLPSPETEDLKWILHQVQASHQRFQQTHQWHNREQVGELASLCSHLPWMQSFFALCTGQLPHMQLPQQLQGSERMPMHKNCFDRMTLRFQRKLGMMQVVHSLTIILNIPAIYLTPNMLLNRLSSNSASNSYNFPSV